MLPYRSVLDVLAAWSGMLRSPAVRELANGRVWEISDQRGFRYALKRVSTFDSADPVRRFTDEARILAFVAQWGLPVAVPVLCDDGSIFTTDVAGGIYALTPMLPFVGGDMPLDTALFQNIGRTIGRMHAALAECPYEIDSWEVGPDTFTECWARIRNRVGIDECVEPWRDEIMRALAEPHRQRVHGDAHGANILTDRRTVTGIIDTDHLPIAPRTYDIAYYVAFWARWEIRRGQPPDHSTEFVRGNLITGYQTALTLTAPELEGISALALAVAVFLVDHFLKHEGIVEDSFVRTVRWIAGRAHRR